MKNKISLLMVALLMTSLSFGQKVKEKAVPPSVIETFRKQYQAAKEVSWEKEGDNYEVEFDLNEVDNSVLYDSTGKVLETEVEILVAELPAGATDYLKKNYPGKKINETAKITLMNGDIIYEAEVKGKDLIFDSNGLFLRESKD